MFELQWRLFASDDDLIWMVLMGCTHGRNFIVGFEGRYIFDVKGRKKVRVRRYRGF
jgi:hypothetical protein